MSIRRNRNTSIHLFVLGLAASTAGAKTPGTKHVADAVRSADPETLRWLSLFALIAGAFVLYRIVKFIRKRAAATAAANAAARARNQGQNALQPGDQFVTLQSFRPTVGMVQGSGSAAKSIAACLLLIVLSVDCLLLLNQAWPFEWPLLIALTRRELMPLAAPGILCIQALLLWFGLKFLRESAIHRQIEPTLASIVSFGVGFRAAKLRALAPRVLVFAVLAGGIYWLVDAIPPLHAAIPRPAQILDRSMTAALPIVAAWLLTVLAFRAVVDRSVRLGLVLPTVLLIVLSVVTQSGDASAQAAVAFEASQIVWFRLIELVLVWTALTSLIHAVISDPANARVFKLVGDGALAADILVEYSPFGGSSDPSPKYLAFALGSAQVLAFTRTFDAPTYEVVNTSDDHLQVSIHDRSIKLLNVTKLLASLPKEISTVDVQGFFKLRFTLGNLATTSIAANARSRLSFAAVEGATQALAKNPDLHGLLFRGARDAFEIHAASFHPVAAACTRILQEVPTAMDFKLQGAAGPSTAQNLDELNAWIAQHEEFARAGRRHLEKQSLLETQLAAAKNGVFDWRALPAQGAGEAVEDLQSAWFRKIIGELYSPQAHAGGGPAPSIDFDEAKFLLSSMGLRFNEVRIVATPQLLQIEQSLGAARASLAAQLKEYQGYYQAALERRTAAMTAAAAVQVQLTHEAQLTQAKLTHETQQLLLQSLLTTPGALTAKNAGDLIRALGIGGLQGFTAAAEAKVVDPEKATLPSAPVPANGGSPGTDSADPV